MKTLVFCLVGVFLSLSIHAQSNPEPGRYPWPGMGAYDVVVCARLVLDAQFVQVQTDGEKLTTVWVHDARGIKLDNGFYGLRINGEVVDISLVYVYHWGRIVNLRTLFSYGSDTVPPSGNPVFDLSPK